MFMVLGTQYIILKQLEKPQKEKKMLKKITSIMFVFILYLLISIPASADKGKPDFSPAVYGDGKVWGTKRTTDLPAPNQHNRHSFDNIYVFTNSNTPMGQLPVAEAAPGNPNYNGGRWIVFIVEWTEQGFEDHGGTVPLITSHDEILLHEGLGHLIVTEIIPPEPFQCPLLPVKE